MCRELNRTQHDTEALGGDAGPTRIGVARLAKHSRGKGGRTCDGWRGRTVGAGGDRMALMNAAPPGLLLSCRCWCAAQLARRTRGGGLEASARFFLRGGGSPRASGAPIWHTHGPRMTRISRGGGVATVMTVSARGPCSKGRFGKRHLRRGGRVSSPAAPRTSLAPAHRTGARTRASPATTPGSSEAC